MFKRRFIFYSIALAVFFGAYVGYRFYENRAKSTPAPEGTYERIESTGRTFLQREETVTQLPRNVARRSSSLTPPVWAYTPEKWESGAIDSIKVIASETDVVGFHAPELSDRPAYQLPLPKEKTLLEGNVIGAQQVILTIFTTPENTPELPLPSFHELQIPSDVPIPYPLIAKAFDSPDDAALTELGDWIKSVGGAARAQSLIEAAGLANSIRIETVTIYRE